MRDGSNEGMQYFDGEIEKLTPWAALISRRALLATNPGNLRLQLADLIEPQGFENKLFESRETPGDAKKESSHAMDPEFERV